MRKINHYPEEWTNGLGKKQLTCVCGNRLPCSDDDNFGICYACDRTLRIRPYKIYTSDGQMQFVGPICYQAVKKSHLIGYRPRLGGPKLYLAAPKEGERKGNLDITVYGMSRLALFQI